MQVEFSLAVVEEAEFKVTERGIVVRRAGRVLFISLIREMF